MTEEDRHVARWKLVKDLSDMVFRVVQMWVVMALVWFVFLSTRHWFAFVVMTALTVAHLAYTICAPRAFIGEYVKSVGAKDWNWFLTLLMFALAGLPWYAMAFGGDAIIGALNDAAHGLSVAQQTPHN